MGGRRPTALAVAAVGLFVLALVLAPTPLHYRLADLDSPTGLPQTLQTLADSLALFGLAAVAAALAVAVAGLVHRWRNGDELLRQQLLVFAAAFTAPILVIPLMPLSFVQPWPDFRR